jgi:hypothetical protein
MQSMSELVFQLHCKISWLTRVYVLVVSTRLHTMKSLPLVKVRSHQLKINKKLSEADDLCNSGFIDDLDGWGMCQSFYIPI